MRNTKIITGNAYLADQKKQNFFSKEELNLILSLYGKGVSSGKWKDYAIDASKDETIFSANLACEKSPKSFFSISLLINYLFYSKHQLNS